MLYLIMYELFHDPYLVLEGLPPHPGSHHRWWADFVASVHGLQTWKRSVSSLHAWTRPSAATKVHHHHLLTGELIKCWSFLQQNIIIDCRSLSGRCWGGLNTRRTPTTGSIFPQRRSRRGWGRTRTAACSWPPRTRRCPTACGETLPRAPERCSGSTLRLCSCLCPPRTSLCRIMWSAWFVDSF